MRILPILLTLFCTGSSFILVPDDLVSLMNALYSRFPPIRIGMNNTKVGLGFRLGRNVDVQFLVELGPQGPPRPTDSSKREAAMAKNPVTAVQNKWPAVHNPVTADPNKWPAVRNPAATDQKKWPTTQNPEKNQNRWPAVHNQVTTDQNKWPVTVQKSKNPATTDQNRQPEVQDPVTVLNWWPNAQNPVTTVTPAIVLPSDFISRLRRRRPGITAPTSRPPDTTTEVLTTELDVKENEIDSGNT